MTTQPGTPAYGTAPSRSGRRRSAGAGRSRSIPDAVNELSAARKMSEAIVAMEQARRIARDAHDAMEVAAEDLRQKCRDSGAWPKGWDRAPEARRWRKLAMVAAADFTDASDAMDTLITRMQRVMEDLNSKNKGRPKFDAAG